MQCPKITARYHCFKKKCLHSFTPKKGGPLFGSMLLLFNFFHYLFTIYLLYLLVPHNCLIVFYVLFFYCILCIHMDFLSEINITYIRDNTVYTISTRPSFMQRPVHPSFGWVKTVVDG